jgi:uncharacterized membrane protein
MDAKKPRNFGACGVCGQRKPASQLLTCDLVRPSIATVLDDDIKDWRRTGWICRTDIQEFRRRAVEEMIVRERGELTSLDRSVIDSLAAHETLTENVEETYRDVVSFGDRLADRTAAFVGSWTFILWFMGVLLSWIGINLVPLVVSIFDPYPFILLNLVLSTIAAIQAPLIMMSQRRQEEKDRMRSQNDYRINLKAELEIRHLHEKIDHLLVRQWDRLSKIQEAQLEMFEELAHGRQR